MLKYCVFFVLFLQLISQVVIGQATATTIYPAQSIQEYLAWKPGKKPMYSAHRGGPQPGFPENCFETLVHTNKMGAEILEIDVSMTKDSVLVLLHDKSLDRTTTGNGLIAEKTFAEIQALNLIDEEGRQTIYRLPSLAHILQWAKDKTILSLDVKRNVPFEKVIDAVKKSGTENNTFIIVYNTEDLKTVHNLAPDLMISANIRNLSELENVINTDIPFSKIIAFTGTIVSDRSLYRAIHQLGVSCIMGTMGNIDRQAKVKGVSVYHSLLNKGVDIIAGDTPTNIIRALEQYKN